MAAARWDNLVYSAAVVLPRLPAFLLLPAIASVLSLSDMGKLATSWVFIELFQTLAGLGLKAALGRYFPMASEPARRREILTISLCGNLAGGLVLGLVTWAVYALPFSRARIHFFDSIDYPVFAALLAVSVLGNLASTFIIYFRAEQRAWAFLTASLIGAGIEAALVVGLLAAGRLTLLNILLIECLKQAAMLAFIAHQGRKDWGFEFSRKTLKTMLVFGVWLVPVGLGEWFVNSSDRFWLGQHGDLDLVGVYGFMYKFAMPLGILFTGGLMDLHARMYRMEGAAGLEFGRLRLHGFLVRSGALSLAYAVSVPAAFLALMEIRPIFPAVYLTGLAAFPIMAAVLYAYYWGKHYAMVLEFHFRTRALMAALTLAAAASLVLIPLAIHLCLASGWDVLTGTAYGALAAQLLSVAFLGRLAGLPGGRAQAAKGLAFIAACAAASSLMLAFR